MAPVFDKTSTFFRPCNCHSSMSELLGEAPNSGTYLPQTYSAPEPDPYSTRVTADESRSPRCVDLPCTSQQRHHTDVCNSALASSSNSRLSLPIPTHVAPTLESLADALTLEQTALQHDSCSSPLPNPSLLYQKRLRPKANFLDRFKRYSPSMTLENRGSVARDHLASERTFLAYTRTSLALSGTGVALVQLFSISDLNFGQDGVPPSATTRTVHKFAKPFGITAIMLGLIILVVGEFFVLRAHRRWGLLIFHLRPQGYTDTSSSRTLFQITNFPLPELPSPFSPSSSAPL